VYVAGSPGAVDKPWLGALEYRVLLFIKDLPSVSPSDLVRAGLVKNRKSAYNYARKLAKIGVLQRVKRGVYRVVREAVEKLLRLSVRDTSPKKKRESGGQREGARSVAVFGVDGVVSVSGGRPCFAGLYLDNVRYWAFGRYCQLEREKLVRLLAPV
jgi:hypothetical protein